jgi:SAM-dependent methyltransferase
MAGLLLANRARRARNRVAVLRARHDARRHPDLPPGWLRGYAGGGDFRAIGAGFKRHFVELGGLEPGHDVLDVGSGPGRMALALTGWLRGRYEGFDVYRAAVEWCAGAISPRHPNFHFRFVDIANAEYNPLGSYQSEELRFPYDDRSFDFAFLTSVFTHLRPAAMENYLSELERVLRPGGVCFATYFLINDEARALLGGTGQFKFDDGDYLTADPKTPERAVAFREEHVRAAHLRQGLPIDRVYYGAWCGRAESRDGQDIVIARRRAS